MRLAKIEARVEEQRAKMDRVTYQVATDPQPAEMDPYAPLAMFGGLAFGLLLCRMFSQ